MTAECKIRYDNTGDLYNFFTGIGCNILQFKLICFMMRHPRTRLSLNSIASVLNINTNRLRQELHALIKKGILVQKDENGNSTYALCADESLLWPLLRLNSLDWREKLDIMSRLKSSAAS